MESPLIATCKCQTQAASIPGARRVKGQNGKPMVRFLCPTCGSNFLVDAHAAILHTLFLRRAGLIRPTPAVVSRDAARARTHRYRGDP